MSRRGVGSQPSGFTFGRGEAFQVVNELANVSRTTRVSSGWNVPPCVPYRPCARANAAHAVAAAEMN